MTMLYQEFKDHLTTFLWKQNDTQLIASLDSLINMGNAALNRDLRHEERHTSALLPITELDVDLPSDYYSLRSVANTDYLIGEFDYYEPAYIHAQRDATQNRAWLPMYSIQRKKLLLVGPASVDDPITLAVHYRAAVPDFKVTDTSWVADDLLDVYTYGVLKHSAPFLREDERVGLWSNMYGEAIMQSNEDSAHTQAVGQSGAALPSRQAGVMRRGDRGRSNKLVR